jgi:hypothetical protein
VVWRSLGQDGDLEGIFARRYDSTGNRVGNEFRVNTFTPSRQMYPTVASAADGGFVVVWDSYNQDGNSYGVFGQRYDAGGVRQGAEFRINTYTTSHQRFPSAASDLDGDFVVVWNSYTQDGERYGIFGQRYDSLGVAQGGEFAVNTYTTHSQRFPSVASDANGNFVVVWSSYGQDGSAYGIFGQRYDSAGNALGDEFQVSSYTPGQQRFPSVSSDADGDFVVVWNSFLQDGSAYGIFGQRYDSSGAPQGGEFRVNSYTTSEQRWPSVAKASSGNFVVTWYSDLQDGNSYGVFGRLYDDAGQAQGDEFQVNTYTTSYQIFPGVGAIGPNQFVVTWESFTQDGSNWAVFGQRYDFGGDTTPPAVTVGAPDGGEKLYTASSYLIRWTATDDTALASFDVSASGDGGASFTPIADCQGLAGQARSCLWLAPEPIAQAALVRVAAQDTSGNSASDDSDAVFRIIAGTAAVTVANPNVNLKWRIGTLQQVRWTHNLGPNSAFRIELDRYDDGTFEELLAAAAPPLDGRRGSLGWTVTGPVSAKARVRISWTGNPAVTDASDVTFQIRPPLPPP